NWERPKKTAGKADRVKNSCYFLDYMISCSLSPSGVATSNVPCVYFSSCWLASSPSSSSSWLTRNGTIKLTSLKIRNETVKLYPTAIAIAFTWIKKKEG